MKPPHRTRVDRARREDPFEALTVAVQSGRLIELLRGDGLSRTVVEELMSPDGSAKIRALLDDHGATSEEPSSIRSRRSPALACKILEFRPKSQTAS